LPRLPLLAPRSSSSHWLQKAAKAKEGRPRERKGGGGEGGEKRGGGNGERGGCFLSESQRGARACEVSGWMASDDALFALRHRGPSRSPPIRESPSSFPRPPWLVRRSSSWFVPGANARAHLSPRFLFSLPLLTPTRPHLPPPPLPLLFRQPVDPSLLGWEAEGEKKIPFCIVCCE